MRLGIKLKNNPKTRITWSIINALIMILITFFLLSTPYVLPDEFTLVRYSSITKDILLDLGEKPNSNRFLFVNVAWDKKLAPKPDPDLATHIIGNEPVTDRAKLVGLLQLLKRKPNYQFIVLDINFKGRTPYDTALTKLINELPNILVSYHRDENDKPDKPDLDIKPLGLSDLETTDDKCLKFKIFFNDSLRSTPLLMYEQIHKKKLNTDNFFYFLNGYPVFNSFILDYRIRNFHYLTKVYPSVHLGEWINKAYKIYPNDMLGLEDIPSQKDDTQAWLDSLENAENGGNTLKAENTEDDTQAWLDSLENAENGGNTLQAESSVEDDTQAWLDSLENAENGGNTLQTENSVDDETQAWLDSLGVDIFEEPLPNNEFNEQKEYDLNYLDSSFTEGFIYPLTKDKIIFVGDFEDRDMHETIYGNTPGPIILLDAFLALEAGDNIIRITFVLFLFLAFGFISYVNFGFEYVYLNFIKRITGSKQVNAIESFTVYTIYFAIVSICSFFLFNIHIGVLVLAFYMYIIDKIKDNLFQKEDTSQ